MEPSRPDRPGPPRDPVRALRDAFRWALTPESLPEIPAAGSDRDSGPGFLGWLLSAEELPPPPATAARSRDSVLQWLLAPEVFPPPPAPSARPGESTLQWLLAPETLPKEPPPAPSSGSLLGWLFRPERLARPSEGREGDET